MGFISGAFNKSVFDKSSYKAAIGDTNNIDGINGYAVIKINPDYARSNKVKDYPIIGVIQKDGLSFSLDATWQELGGIAGSLFPNQAGYFREAYGLVNNTSMVMGNADWGAIAASRKIYQKSGYLKISPSMRIVDWKGIGQPILSALLLAAYATPSSKEVMTVEDVEEWLQNLYDDFKERFPKTGEFIEGVAIKAETFLSNAVDTAQNVDQTYAGGAGEGQVNSTKNQLKDIDKDLSLRSSPVPVTVSIGHFFKRPDMIIENISFSFSREMTVSGPLYVDVDLTLSSRKIVSSAEDLGLLLPGRKSRVVDDRIDTNTNSGFQTSDLA